MNDENHLTGRSPNGFGRYSSTGRWRHEYKYIIDAAQEEILKVRMNGILFRDPHVRKDGSYLIRSLYFDDLGDSCLTENLAGSDPRSKFRIRYYNNESGRIQLEKKSKYRGMCIKDSCELSSEECGMLMNGKVPALNETMDAQKRKLLTEMELRHLIPKVIVTYERIPFVYSGGNVRITFDRKISSSGDILQFLTGMYAERPVLGCGRSVLEVKWDEVLPQHIREVMRLEGLEWTAFSKYYMCRRFHL